MEPILMLSITLIAFCLIGLGICIWILNSISEEHENRLKELEKRK